MGYFVLFTCRIVLNITSIPEEIENSTSSHPFGSTALLSGGMQCDATVLHGLPTQLQPCAFLKQFGGGEPYGLVRGGNAYESAHR